MFPRSPSSVGAVRALRFTAWGLFAVAAVWLLYPARAVAAVLTVSPVKIELRMWPGAVEQRSILLKNGGDATLTVDASRADYRRTPDGSAAFSAPGRGRLSCARWVSVQGAPLVLRAGESRSVVVRLSVPTSASVGLRQAAVLLSAGTGSVGALAQGRVAVLVLLNVEASRPVTGATEPTSLDPAAGDASGSDTAGAGPVAMSLAVRWLAVVAGALFAAGVGLLLLDLFRRRHG